MAVTERSRHNVHKHFEETMGEELAATLMEMLPGVGWADVARRRDLEDLRTATTQEFERLRDWSSERFDAVEKRFDAIDKRFDAIDKRFDALDERFVTHKDLNRHTFVLVTATAAFVTIATALGRIL